MSRGPKKNLPASVRQRLLNLARERGEDFNFTLTRYANERLLYRLGCSPYRDEFVLKGAAVGQKARGRGVVEKVRVEAFDP